ncbi:unnamed protein product [Symbiodinium natans]|uniref:Uncharacterized protein n=1 Tax=Symbiodinium natans TaxID=878477 RepID=A0A812T390_9DINO|nr:unnamed protein product [Symbiodinium natans]
MKPQVRMRMSGEVLDVGTMPPGSTISQLQERIFLKLRHEREVDVLETSSVNILTESGSQLLAAQSIDFGQSYLIQLETQDWQDQLNLLCEQDDSQELRDLKGALIAFSACFVEDSPDETVGSTAEFGDAVRSIYKLVTRRAGEPGTRSAKGAGERVSILCRGLFKLIEGTQDECSRTGQLLLERIQEEYGHLLEED